MLRNSFNDIIREVSLFSRSPKISVPFNIESIIRASTMKDLSYMYADNDGPRFAEEYQILFERIRSKQYYYSSVEYKPEIIARIINLGKDSRKIEYTCDTLLTQAPNNSLIKNVLIFSHTTRNVKYISTPKSMDEYMATLFGDVYEIYDTIANVGEYNNVIYHCGSLNRTQFMYDILYYFTHANTYVNTYLRKTLRDYKSENIPNIMPNTFNIIYANMYNYGYFWDDKKLRGYISFLKRFHELEISNAEKAASLRDKAKEINEKRKYLNRNLEWQRMNLVYLLLEITCKI